MEQKDRDRELLLKDLSARLPYGVYVKDINKGIKVCKIYEIKPGHFYCLTLIPISDSYYYQVYYCDIDSVRPYLRQMSSMTKEELAIFNNFNQDDPERFDYLNSIHVDYRMLIPRGLAITVTEENNPYKF